MQQALAAASQCVETAQNEYDTAKDAATAAKEAAREADKTVCAKREALEQKQLLLQEIFTNQGRQKNHYSIDCVRKNGAAGALVKP